MTTGLSTIITGPDQLTSDYFDRALGFAPGAVQSVAIEPIGNGLMAQAVRASLTGGDGVPDSVVVKFATDDAGSFQVANALDMYGVETRFYRDVAPHLEGFSMPNAHASDHDEASGRFTIVMDDIDAVPGDALTELDTAQLRAAVSQLVALQAPLWPSATTPTWSWLQDTQRLHGVFDMLSASADPFIERFREHLDPEHLELYAQVVGSGGKWVRSWTAPLVVQHGDFRPDNFMWRTDGEGTALTVLDFQTVRLGPPGVDLAYLLGSALSVQRRRAEEEGLVGAYHAALLEKGVEGFDADACWTSYRAGALYGVILFVGGAGQVQSTPRGDQMLAAQATKFAQMAADLNALEAGGLA